MSFKSTLHQALGLLFILCLYACSSPEENSRRQVVFGVVSELGRADLEEIKIPPVLYKSYRTTATEDFLIYYGKARDTVFRVFDIHTFEYLGGFGKPGDGPDNFDLSGSQYSQLPGNRLFTVAKTNIRTIELKKNETTGLIDYEVLDRHKMPGELYPFNHVFQLNDSTYMGEAGFVQPKMMKQVQKGSGEMVDIIDFPDYHPEFADIYDWLLYQGYRDYHPANKKYVATFIFQPGLRIYDFATDTYIDISITPRDAQGVFQELGDGKNLNLRDQNTYYYGLRLTEKYIYAWYYPEVRWQTDQEFRRDPELHIFDYEGNPQRKFVLEEWMRNFAPSMDDEYLYFWHENEEDKIFRYALPN